MGQYIFSKFRLSIALKLFNYIHKFVYILKLNCDHIAAKYTVKLVNKWVYF